MILNCISEVSLLENNNIEFTDEQILEIIKNCNKFEKALIGAFINGIKAEKSLLIS